MKIENKKKKRHYSQKFLFERKESEERWINQSHSINLQSLWQRKKTFNLKGDTSKSTLKNGFNQEARRLFQIISHTWNNSWTSFKWMADSLEYREEKTWLIILHFWVNKPIQQEQKINTWESLEAFIPTYTGRIKSSSMKI